jgi:hypothetical protein
MAWKIHEECDAKEECMALLGEEMRAEEKSPKTLLTATFR